ncbi:tyrosine-type recombinase/integrase [Nonomuraea sp. NPDC003754]
MDEQRLLLRAVPCPLPLAECLALRNARPAGPPPTSPTEPVTVQRVVCSRGHFQVVGQKTVYNETHSTAQLPHARLHDLRHIHATTLLLAGVPVHVVAARLGHADPSITLRVYAHVIRAAEASAADVFAQAIGE